MNKLLGIESRLFNNLLGNSIGKPRDSLMVPTCDHFARVSLTIFGKILTVKAKKLSLQFYSTGYGVSFTD